MYGMIHRAVRQMVFDELGEDVWLALEHKLGIGPTELLTGMVYDDALTIAIISEASARLNISVDACLFEFGRYWIKYAEHGSLASIMNFTGQDLASFIKNLDRLHLAVGAAMPGARLPSFTTISKEPGRLMVEYRSDRTGLEQFVLGLFDGLITRFGATGDVKIAEHKANVIVFELQYQDES
jgi:guanylate cyclase soluble subunit beta